MTDFWLSRAAFGTCPLQVIVRSATMFDNLRKT